MSDESMVSENDTNQSGERELAGEREWVIEADGEIVTSQLMRVIEDYKLYQIFPFDEDFVARMKRSENYLTIEEYDCDPPHGTPTYRVSSGKYDLYKVSEKRCTLRIVMYKSEEQIGDHWNSFFKDIEKRFEAVGIAYRTLLGPGKALIAEALRGGECQGVEFKQATPDKNKLAKEIAAFATSNAGRIFLGIADDGRVVGLRNCQGSKEQDALRNDIDNICSNNVRPPITAGIEFVRWDLMTVCVISVPKGLASIYYVNNVPYIRRGSQARPADPAEVEAIYAQRYTQVQSSR